MIYSRTCPRCETKINYTNSFSFFRAIKSEAICAKCNGISCRKINTNLKILLGETNVAYYILGLIFSDGHISNSKRLRISLHNRDFDYLMKIKEILNITNYVTIHRLNQTSISAQDSIIIPKVCEKYNIKSNKTEFPPDISSIDDTKKLMSLFCGMVDGDGNISLQSKGRKDFFLRIKCHHSWMNIYQFINEKLFNNNASLSINRQGYLLFSITDTFMLKNIKRMALSLNIPLMERKWDKIDLEYKTKKERIEDLTPNIINDLINLSIQKVADKYNLSYSCIKRIKNEN